MAENENNLTANNVYFKEVPDESGLQLTLEETLRKNLVGLITCLLYTSPSPRD